ncbi:CueP family metal-binding protein [Ureibacillus sp. MALMAid1270]|uniref:CueP family metal-binding protein n=1 Tax=Ureibacillus sp. MALMAid1270 TaxID=3411629 RepID=UPI003BA58B35
MKIKMLTVTLFAAIFLVACNGENANEESSANVGEPEDIKELVQNYSVRNLEAKSASITSEQIVVTENDGKEVIYELPKDEFFVSIAPFINQTHPCEIHSLTSCQGELVNEQFDVYIEDSNGNVVLDETLQTQVNGFIDLWLPRDQTYNITIEHEGKKAESKFSTFKNDGTCITTMQLI